jgi:hypothetical protein
MIFLLSLFFKRLTLLRLYTDMANGMLVFYGACNTILAVSLQLISFEAEKGISREQC